MKRLIAVICLLALTVLAAEPLQAATKVLSVYPHQLKDWATRTTAFVLFDPVGVSSSDQVEFLCPVKLPVGARVSQFKAWARDGTGISWARLIRARDGFPYSNPADNLAEIDLNDGALGVWTLLVDTTEDGPAPPRIAAGYRYYVYVHLQLDFVGTIQIVYTTP